MKVACSAAWLTIVYYSRTFAGRERLTPSRPLNTLDAKVRIAIGSFVPDRARDRLLLAALRRLALREPQGRLK